jgi:hypothetical protein
VLKKQYYLGVDPGVNGGVVVLDDKGCRLVMNGQDDLNRVVRYTLESYQCGQIHIAVEQQQPRPTYWKGRSSILKSTCMLYGQYRELKGLLDGMGYLLRTEEPLPQQWQKDLGIKSKGSLTDSQWKKKLKGIAESLFPDQKITLKTADAFLIAYWLRCLKTGCKPSLPEEVGE